MFKKWFAYLFTREDPVFLAEYAPMRRKLAMAGLRESQLRRMSPDKRVQVLEAARLDPYDFLYLSF